MPKRFSETEEIWKPVPRYKGWYEVSSFGRVRSLPRYFKHRDSKVFYQGGILIPNRSHKYYYVFLSKNGVRKKHYIHSLVLKAFKRCRLEGDKRLCCNHKDGNKLNNHVNNLEWSNYSLNGIHAYAMGLKKRFVPKNAFKAGEGHPNSRFTNEERLKICEDYKVRECTAKEFAESKGLSYAGLARILRRENTWRELVTQKNNNG